MDDTEFKRHTEDPLKIFSRENIEHLPGSLISVRARAGGWWMVIILVRFLIISIASKINPVNQNKLLLPHNLINNSKLSFAYAICILLTF